MKNIQHGKRLKHDQETFRLRIAGKKKIGLLSRVMSACLDVRTPHREKQSDAGRNSSNSVPNLELQTNEQVVELQCIVSPLPFVSFSDVAATKINNIDMKETSLREDLTGPLYSDTYDQGVVSSVRSDIQNCVPHVYQVKEGKSDIDRTSEGISENYRVEQEKDGIDSNGVNFNLNIEKEKATIQEKVISVEMCRKRDRELGRMKNEDEMKELYSCLKKSRAILWQSSESTETICPNSNPIQDKHDFQNNLPTGNMVTELSTVIMNSDSGLENVIVKN